MRKMVSVSRRLLFVLWLCYIVCWAEVGVIAAMAALWRMDKMR